jgi:hypothetical protein
VNYAYFIDEDISGKKNKSLVLGLLSSSAGASGFPDYGCRIKEILLYFASFMFVFVQNS